MRSWGQPKNMATNWPPPEPIDGNIAFFGGFPARGRVRVGERVGFGLYLGLHPMTVVNDRQIICRFCREDWIEVDGDEPASAWIGSRRDERRSYIAPSRRLWSSSQWTLSWRAQSRANPSLNGVLRRPGIQHDSEAIMDDNRSGKGPFRARIRPN